MASRFKGKRRRRCQCCHRCRYYCASIVGVHVVRNPQADDVARELASGSIVCDECVLFNNLARFVRELKVASATKRCLDCNGKGTVPNPTKPRIANDRPRFGKGDYWRCTSCNGEGRVPA